MPHARDIPIRDPFVVPVPEEQSYYLFGTTDRNCWDGPGTGFDCYVGKDLESWQGPHSAFVPPASFWADRNFWAPEVHRWHARYFMFASFKAEGICRGTQILSSASVRGPYLPVSEHPVTPADWECLDGTLYVDDDGSPWLVFCHEWVQIGDGSMCACRLSDDLTRRTADPIELFRASAAPWVKPINDKGDRVTDGPFLLRTGRGTLAMIWSSFGVKGYAMGVARSESGKVAGPWIQDNPPLFEKDGGHGMVFRTFDGDLMVSLHSPNDTPNERPVFFPVRDVDGRLVRPRG